MSKYNKLKQWLKRHKFRIYQSLIFIVGFGCLVYYLCEMENSFTKELTSTKNPLNLRNIFIALAAISTALFTWWKNNTNERISLSNERTRQDELFSKAVEFLKESNDLTTRKGGVHILKELALTSPQQTQKCIEMLCSINDEWIPKILDSDPDFFVRNSGFVDKNNIDNLLINDKTILQNLKEKILLSQLVFKVIEQINSEINGNNKLPSDIGLFQKILNNDRAFQKYLKLIN